MDSDHISNQRDTEYLRIDSRTHGKLFKILTTLELKCWDKESLKKETGLNQQELDLSLTILKLHGYLEEIKKTSNCILCLTREQCINSQKIYRITEKGRKLLSEMTKQKL
ncbi:MAG: hypothetical protein L4877_04785 [Aigarchaeota archaeon]|nr:hypothetical protein [Candidatus Geocrenenecus dongiae]